MISLQFMVINNRMNSIISFFPSHRQKHGGRERWRNLPRVSQRSQNSNVGHLAPRFNQEALVLSK
jgi:hypothetical protein